MTDGLLGWIFSISAANCLALSPLSITIRPVCAAQYWPVDLPCHTVHPRLR